MPEVGLEPTLPGGNRILSHVRALYKLLYNLRLQNNYHRVFGLSKGFSRPSSRRAHAIIHEGFPVLIHSSRSWLSSKLSSGMAGNSDLPFAVKAGCVR